MTLYINGTELAPSKMCVGSSEVSKLIFNSEVIYNSDAVAYFPRSPINLGVIGDSTIAAGYGGLGIADYIPEFTPVTSVAKGGSIITTQTRYFNELTNHLDFDAVIMQIGLNDLTPESHTLEELLTKYQVMVDAVNARVRSRCKVYVAKILPCKSRLQDVYGAEWEESQARWVALNDFIMNTVTGVDGRIDSHVPILDDGNGNLKAIYDTGDGIHENVAGRQVIANAWRDKLISDNILTP